MSVSKNIAWKYLRFSGSKSVKAMTIISILGIAIGVATLTITLSIANGFGKEYQKSILDFSAHVVLLSTDEIGNYDEKLDRLEKYKVSNSESEKWKQSFLKISFLKMSEYIWIKLDELYLNVQYSPVVPKFLFNIIEALHPGNVAAWMYRNDLYPKYMVGNLVETMKLYQSGIIGISPFIYREGLLIHKGKIRGIMIKGINPTDFEKISRMNIDFGDAGNIDKGIVLGSFLSKELGAEKGDKVRIMLPQHWSERGATSFDEFVVAGTFESGMYDFDSQFAILDLEVAQKIFDAAGKISGIEIKLDDWKKSQIMAMTLEREFPYPIYASDWRELNKSLFEAVKLEKLMFIIIMGALVIVAAFNIIGTVMLRILYKTSDISILRALGMKIINIKKVFVLQGLAVGVLGTGLGLIAALVLLWSVVEFNWVTIPPEIYLLKTLPVCISFLACVMIAAFSLAVCWITSVVASNRIVGLPVLKGLHRP